MLETKQRLMKSLFKTKSFLFLFSFSLAIEGFFIGGMPIARIIAGLVFLFAFLDAKRLLVRPKSDVFFLLVTYFSISLVSLLWSYNLEDGFVSFFTYTQVFLIGLVILNFLTKARDLINFFKFYTLGCVVASMNVLFNFFTGYSYRGVHYWEEVEAVRYSAFDVDPNETGMLLVIGASFILDRIEKGRLIKKILGFCLLILVIVAIFLTASRTGFALLLLSIFVFLFHKKREIKFLFLFSLLLGVITAILFYTNFIPIQTFNRIFSLQANITSGSFNSREVAWENLVLILAQHPFLGVGLGGIYEALQDNGMVVMSSHNTYLNIIAQLGVLGFIPYFLICFKSFFIFYKYRFEYGWLLNSYVVLLIGIFTLTYDQRKMIWIFFFIAAGLEMRENLFKKNKTHLNENTTHHS